jgi:hypothetical protein
MKTLDLKFERGRWGGAWALMVIVAVLNLSGCSDSPTEPDVNALPALVATVTSLSVIAGDPVQITITPTRPCWGEAAEMEAVLSWDTTRFAWVETPGVTIEHSADGRIRARGADRDGFSNGMDLAFRALAGGSTTNLVVESVVMRCESHRVMVFFHPPLLVAHKP